MTHAPQTIAEAWPFTERPRRLVVKLGSNILSTPEGTLDATRIETLAAAVGRLHESGAQVIIVSSGAVAAGMGRLGLKERPRQLPRLQALASVGQSRLMRTYSDAFHQYGVPTAQILLTRGDLEDRRRYLNAHETIEALLEMGAVPVINENDTVTTDELTFGDNDLLSAFIAVKSSAELLVLLTDIDGLYSANPQKSPDAHLIEVVQKVTSEIEALGAGPGSRLGRGGMASKLSAARHATRFGIPTVIANGRCDSILDEVASGQFRGTLFLAQSTRRGKGRARLHWISTHRPRGSVQVDDGAAKMLLTAGKSLLPVGVVAVEGDFERGDVISIRDGQEQEIARGITNYNTAEVRRLMGCRVRELRDESGAPPPYEELVHRDNLHVRR
ncbi:glutamate 5-kinase [bacterium]|nr:glutamate 5-kinase [bacterium]